MSTRFHCVNDFNVAVVIMQRDQFKYSGVRIKPEGKNSLRMVIIQRTSDEWRIESCSYVVFAYAMFASRLPDDHDAADH